MYKKVVHFYKISFYVFEVLFRKGHQFIFLFLVVRLLKYSSEEMWRLTICKRYDGRLYQLDHLWARTVDINSPD